MKKLFKMSTIIVLLMVITYFAFHNINELSRMSRSADIPRIFSIVTKFS